MIKGVNRQIIEVRETDSRYFERALLFVDPTCRNEAEESLKKEADRILSQYAGDFLPAVSRTGRTKNNTVGKARLAFFLLGAAVGAAVCLGLTLIF
ncbi:MAG: hypothetical protein IJY56_00050 [Clostridia bacterium]|nr:hypothetical protein [Clostridia bacterium]